MPDATFLHIHTRDTAAPRVLEMVGSTIRIGRGIACEVRLVEPSLAEIQCLLARRGMTWLIQPVGPSGRITLDGHAVEEQRPLPLGSTLQIGDARLSLRSGHLSALSQSPFEAPIPADPEILLATNVPPAEPAWLNDHAYHDPTRPRTLDASANAIEDERRRLSSWQARLETREHSLRNRARERRWEARFRAAGEEHQVQQNARSSPRPPDPEPPVPATPPPARHGPIEDASGPVVLPFAAEAFLRSVGISPPSSFPLRIDDPDVDVAWPHGGEVSASGVPDAPSERIVEEDHTADPAGSPPETPHPPVGIPASAPASAFDVAPDPHPPEAANPIGETPRVEPPWPRVADILATAVTDRPGSRQAAPRKASGRRPEPTVGRGPSAWRVPWWLALPAVVLLIVPTAVIGLRLSWTWSQDDRASGQIANQLLNSGTLPTAMHVPPDAPAATWWSTTSGHLLLRAIASSRSELGLDRDDPTRDLLELARGTSPLDPAVRIALQKSGSDAMTLGASRDVIALHLQGNLLRDQGKFDAALASYRSALTIAGEADPEAELRFHFVDDPRVRRFQLPNEGAISEVVRDLITAAGSDPDRWAAALPELPVVALAVARQLRERREPVVRRVADQVLADNTPRSGMAGALDLAARGEVMALDGRLAEAASLYREAFERADLDSQFRRILAYNLADIEGRLGHLDAMVDAWKDARNSDLNDIINIHLIEARMRRDRQLQTRGTPVRDDAVQRAAVEFSGRP